MKTTAALLAIAIAAALGTTRADEPVAEPRFGTLRFAPADYSPYDTRHAGRSDSPRVDWRALAPDRPQGSVAVPAIIRVPADPRALRH